MKKFLTLFILCLTFIQADEITPQQQAKNYPSAPIDLTEENLDHTIRSSDIPIVVDISAKWCGACKKINPIIDELSQQYAGQVLFVKIDTDVSPSSIKRFGITGIPTLLFYKVGDTNPVVRHVGYMSKQDFETNIQALR